MQVSEAEVRALTAGRDQSFFNDTENFIGEPGVVTR